MKNPVHTPAFESGLVAHQHPIELALLLAVITIEAMRTLLALVITLASYRPRPQIPAGNPEKNPATEVHSPTYPEIFPGKNPLTNPAPAEPCGAADADPADQDQSQHPVDPPATPAPRSKAPRAKRPTASEPVADRAPAPRSRRRKPVAPAPES